MKQNIGWEFYEMGAVLEKRNKIIINNHLKEVKEISNMFGASLLTLRNKRK